MRKQPKRKPRAACLQGATRIGYCPVCRISTTQRITIAGGSTGFAYDCFKRDDSDPSGKFAWILDPEGKELGRQGGYAPGSGPEAYIQKLSGFLKK